MVVRKGAKKLKTNSPNNPTTTPTTTSGGAAKPKFGSPAWNTRYGIRKFGSKKK